MRMYIFFTQKYCYIQDRRRKLAQTHASFFGSLIRLADLARTTHRHRPHRQSSGWLHSHKHTKYNAGKTRSHVIAHIRFNQFYTTSYETDGIVEKWRDRGRWRPSAPDNGNLVFSSVCTRNVHGVVFVRVGCVGEEDCVILMVFNMKLWRVILEFSAVNIKYEFCTLEMEGTT